MMNTEKKERLNDLAKNFDDIEVRRTLMREFGDSETAFSGVNENGEDILISIATGSIVVSTYQHNGWVRVNYYNADGYDDGETFKGRWKE